MMRVPAVFILAVLGWALALCLSTEKAASASEDAPAPAWMHGIAMHGALKYPPGFTHFAYVNPDAPKGGRLTLSAQGSFDSLNPSIVKGNPAGGIRAYVYESLMARAYDEPFSLYGLLAKSIETPPDRSWVAFTLRPEARFSDGKPVTVEDVIFTQELLRDHGRPNHRFYYSKIAKAEKTGPHSVKFTFKPGSDREMPLIMGLMPILPRHAISPDTFEQTTLTPPIGSGPYVVADVNPGSSVTFRRNPDYWGKDLPVNRGRYNFDTIHYDYYRDANTMFEAFKKGLALFTSESDPSRWARQYDFPAVRDGQVLKESFKLGVPAGMAALVFNTRRAVFADKRVREALTLLFDFEWINKNLFYGAYARTQSFFARSELSSFNRPADAYERELLAPFAGEIDPAIMAGRFAQPKSPGTGRNRANRRKALSLLKAAGYKLRGGVLVNKASGKPFTFEILAATREQERLLLTFARELKGAGIVASIRLVDSAQYQRRKQTFDFDMIQNSWPASLSPGNEQSFRWSSKAADRDGSFNYPGVKSPAVDAMIGALLAAKSREHFVSAAHALDRALLSGRYVIPLYHLPKQWVAYWRQLNHPKTSSLYGALIDTWWMAKDAKQAEAD